MNTVRYLLTYLGKRKKLAIGVITSIIIAQVAELTIPLLIGALIDRILNAVSQNQFSIDIIWIGVFFIIGVSFIRGITHFSGRYLGYIQGERIIYEIRQDLFDKYENSSLAFFDQMHTGDLMARATTDLEPMAEFLIWGERILLQASLTYLGVYTVLLLLDFRLFVMIGLVTPLLFLLSYFVSRKLGPLYFDIRTQYGVLTTVIQENIAGAQIVRSFNAERRESAKFDRENLAYQDLRAYAFKIRSLFLPTILFIVNLLITLLIFLGGLQVIEGNLSPGFFVTMISYFTLLATPTRFLAFSMIMFERVKAAGERVFTLLEEKTIISEIENPINISHLTFPPTIVFNDVTFAYDEKPVLRNVNLTLHPGERVAVLGPTGSGKTALISMIPRFYDPSAGFLTVSWNRTDNYRLNNLFLKQWREKIGFVHQEPFLWGRTISENVSFGLTDIKPEEIEEVLRIVQLDEFVKSLPDGIETLLGERGVTLSGGQKQRVAIARMLLRKRPVLILDDATSALDITTETKFQQAFERYLKDHHPTVVLITQRLSTLKMVDRIIIMHQGQIFEEGTHEELMRSGEIYPLLYKTQYEDDGLVDVKLALERIVKERIIN
ncbi:MAG: ABC transporter ATP-binding protein [Candidatus Heimdallarchaeota archaeon]